MGLPVAVFQGSGSGRRNMSADAAVVAYADVKDVLNQVPAAVPLARTTVS
jgi:hypothetical protein